MKNRLVELRELFAMDRRAHLTRPQADSPAGMELQAADRARRERLWELLKEDVYDGADDFFQAARVMGRSDSPADVQEAVRLAGEAASAGHPSAAILQQRLEVHLNSLQ